MNIPLGDTYYLKFTTRSFSTGAPTTLSGTPVVSVYEENNLTQITTGVTLTADYDSVTGLNDVAIVATSGNGYEAGKYYSVVITTGTVGGVSVVGEVVGHFRVMAAETQAGIPQSDVTYVSGSAEDIATATALATVDTNVDAILVDTGTTLPAQITTAQNDLDILTGTDGVTLASSQPNTITWSAQIYSVAGATNNITFAGSGTGDVFAFTRSGSGTLLSTAYATAFNGDTNLDAILTDTGTTIPATLGTPAGADMSTDIAAIKTVVDSNATAIGGLNDLSAAQVNAEVVDALATDTYAEPGQGNPAATTSLAAKINYLYKAWRNKSEQTATTYSLYDDAGTTVDQKATVSDDGTTATKGEIATGP